MCQHALLGHPNCKNDLHQNIDHSTLKEMTISMTCASKTSDMMFLVCGHKEICFPVLLFFDDLGGNTSHVLKCFCPLVTCLTSMQQNSTKEVAPEKTNKRNMSCFVKQQKLFLSDLLNVNTEMLLESLKKLENALI